MSRKEIKFYAINFIDPWIIFFFFQINTRCNENVYSKRIKKVRRKEGMKCEQVNGSEQFSLKYPDFS